mgnify:CR=1 FL=1
MPIFRCLFIKRFKLGVLFLDVIDKALFSVDRKLPDGLIIEFNFGNIGGNRFLFPFLNLQKDVEVVIDHGQLLAIIR